MIHKNVPCFFQHIRFVIGVKNRKINMFTLNASILHRSPHSSGRNSIVLFSEKSQYELLDEVLISECEKINGIQKTIVTTQVKVIAIV